VATLDGRKNDGIMNMNKQNILILAPHTDDGEFGCGGTINKMIEEGHNIYYIAFSACQQSVLPQFPSDILITEVKSATAVLGIPKENLILHDFEVRTFSYRRQEILEVLVKLNKEIKPDLVFMPMLDDLHQDHSTIAMEGFRAFKFSSIYSYEVPWNNVSFHTSCFINISENQLIKKVNALNEYKSQAHRTYANENFIRSLATVRGTQSGLQYAEAFQIQRLITK
jgi:N-acetylglucosamine malate deacetylase 1